jgi:integrase
MPRKINFAALAQTDGRHSFGNSLSLHVRGASALWTFKYRDRETKAFRSKVLGSYHDGMGLTEARAGRAKFWHELINRRPSSGMTLGEVLEAWITKRTAEDWTEGSEEGDKYRRLIRECPTLCALPVADVTSDDVEAALAPWLNAGKLVMADKQRKRIKAAIDYAILRGWRANAANPARVGIISKPNPDSEVNHPALPWRELPGFMAELLADQSAAARALAFTILTASRNGKVRAATWSQIKDGVWIPEGNRVKGTVAVALSPILLKLIGDPGKPGALIFGELGRHAFDDLAVGLPSDTPGRSATIHGFRTSFRTWARAQKLDSETAEQCLGHLVGSKAARAYDRDGDDTLELRAELLAKWTAFVCGK